MTKKAEQKTNRTLSKPQGDKYAIPDSTRGLMGDGPLGADHRRLCMLCWPARASDVLIHPLTFNGYERSLKSRLCSCVSITLPHFTRWLGMTETPPSPGGYDLQLFARLMTANTDPSGMFSSAPILHSQAVYEVCCVAHHPRYSRIRDRLNRKIIAPVAQPDRATDF